MKRFSTFLGFLFAAYTIYSFVIAFRFQQVYLASYDSTFWDMPWNVITYVGEKVATPFGFSMVFFILPHMGRLPSRRDLR